MIFKKDNYIPETHLNGSLTVFPDTWNSSRKKTYPYDQFNRIDDLQKPGTNIKIEDFFNKLWNGCSSDEKIERIKKILNFLILKMEKY